jgi:hypothetical protein
MATSQQGCCLWLVCLRGVCYPYWLQTQERIFVQNFVVNIVEVQTLGGIVLLGGDFNAHIVTLLDTIDTSDLCELLQAPELAETKQPNVVAKWQNRDTNVSGWGREFLDLWCDVGLLILNGRTSGNESKDTCLANGGHSIINYIVGSPVIWQTVTHLKVIVDDTHYCAMGGDSNHRPLRL